MNQTNAPAPRADQAEAPAIQDSALLRMGGLSPIFRPESVADAGKLRIGGLSPIFQAG